MQLVTKKSDLPHGQRREGATEMPWSTLAFVHSLQWNKGELGFNLLMFTFKMSEMLPVLQGLTMWIKPRSAVSS